MPVRTRRGFLFGLTITSGAVATCSTAGMVTAQETPIGDSPMDQYDAANTGYAPNERGPRNTPRELWRSDAGAALTGSTAVVDGVAYTADKTGTIRALDAVSGAERWTVSLDAEVVTSPVVTGDTVYVSAGESLYALAASDGTERWMESVGADPSTPVTADGLVFVTGGNTVHAFVPDGTAVTTADLTGEVVSTPAVVGSTVYAATDAGTMYAFDIDQSDRSVTFTEQWTTGTVIDRRPTVTVSDGTLIVTGASPGQSEQGRVYALSADTGEGLWEFTTTSWIESAAAIDDDTVYVGVDNGDVVALAAASGTERWRFNANDSWSFLYWGPGVTAGPVVTDDTVYVGSEDDNLYAIDADAGTLRWRFSTGDAIVSTPTVVDGIAFIGSTDGRLYAVTSPDASPVPLTADTGSDGVTIEDDAQTTGDGGALGFNVVNGVRGLITAPVTVLVLIVGLLYGIRRVFSNDSNESDTTAAGPSVERHSPAASESSSPQSVTVEQEREEATPGEPSDNVASASPDGQPSEAVTGHDGSAESQRTALLDELRELDGKWSTIDRKLLYSVGDHHPDEYEATFGSLDAALAAAGVTATAPTDEESGTESSRNELASETHREDDAVGDDAVERGHQEPRLRDQLAASASIAEQLATQLPTEPSETPPASESQAACPSLKDTGEPATAASTATSNPPPTDSEPSDPLAASGHSEAESNAFVRTADGIDDTARHPTPVVLRIREQLTEDGRRHVFRAETVDGESVQLDVWNQHLGEFDWKPDAWYVFEAVRGQHWTVNGESGVTVSTTPDTAVTRRDSIPESPVTTR